MLQSRRFAMRVKRAEKYGFCAGVRIADRKVKKLATLGGTDGKILDQVVHNERVVEEMEELGVPTVDALDEIDEGTVIFSAHGVPPSFHRAAQSRELKVLDTTCPFVYDIHEEADRAVQDGGPIWSSSANQSTGKSSATPGIAIRTPSMCSRPWRRRKR